MPLKEYQPGTAFNGVIGRTFDVSSPAWPKPLRAKEGAPVTDEYRPPFAFTGKIHTVTIDVSGEPIQDDEAALRAVMARQ